MSAEMLDQQNVLDGVRLSRKRLAGCFVKAWRAIDLTRDETKALMNWCDHQAEDLWDGMALQEILNVYRLSAPWENFEAWAEAEGDKARRAWNSMVRPMNHLQLGRGK